MEALNLGADDYITKPFSFEEVMARINAVVRRSKSVLQSLVINGLELDLITRILRAKKGKIKLPEKEFELLKYFITNKNPIIIKYSDGDTEIVLKANVVDSEVRIVVEDYGVGISDQDKDAIFDRFYRGQWSEMAGIKGYGLGLSLVQSIVNAMGGTVSVEDNQPQGTRFIVTLNALKLS